MREARRAGLRAAQMYTPAGYWYTMTAKLAVVSGGTHDVNRYVCPPTVFNLWHGVPLKAIEYDSTRIKSRLDQRRRISRFFPFHEERNFSAIASSSQREATQLASAFRVPESRVVVVGQPRTDALLAREPKQKARVILYAPTFRDADPASPIRILERSRAAVEARLQSLDGELHVRLHPNTPRARVPEDSLRVHWASELATSSNLPHVLNDVDVLITDYSSIYIDFLFTRRPAVFFPYDKAAYLAGERELYLDYDSSEVRPGPEARDWAQVMDEIENLLDDDRYADVRQHSLGFFCERHDQESSQRAFAVAHELAKGANR